MWRQVSVIDEGFLKDTSQYTKRNQTIQFLWKLLGHLGAKIHPKRLRCLGSGGGGVWVGGTQQLGTFLQRSEAEDVLQTPRGAGGCFFFYIPPHPSFADSLPDSLLTVS